MADGDDRFDPRAALLDMLLERVAEDVYPSTTMLDLIEQIAEPDELSAYLTVLLEKIRNDTYPSIPMMQRVIALSSGH